MTERNFSNPNPNIIFGPTSPKNTITMYKVETPDRKGTIEERRSQIDLGREPTQPTGILDTIKFGLQLYIGDPGHGQVAVINPNIVATWQNSIARAIGQYDPGGRLSINLPILRQLATVSVEKDIHSCIIDQGVHPVKIGGSCIHTQKVWTSKYHQISFGVCRCGEAIQIPTTQL